MATVLLARHGETAWTRAGRVQGWAPTRLTDRGREEAGELAARIDRRHAPDRLVSSDLARARATADRVADATGRPVETDPRWRERDYGRLQGLESDDLYDRFPRLSLTHRGTEALGSRPRGGESLADARDRVLDAWEELRTELEAGETAVVVTHEVPIHAVRAATTGRDFAGVLLEDEVGTGAVVEVPTNEGSGSSETGIGTGE